MPQPAQRVGTGGRGQEFQGVGFVRAVTGARHGFPQSGGSTVRFRAGTDLLARRDVQKLAALEMGREQGLDLPAELGALAASLVQIVGTGGYIG